MRCVTRVLRRRGPYNAPLFNLPILPEQKNGRVKNNRFFWNWSCLLSGWVTWRVRVREPKKAFMMSRRLWVFLGSMLFQWWRCCAFGFPRGCSPINSILCLLLHFFLLRFFWEFLLLLPSMLSFASSEWSPRTFLPVIFAPQRWLFCSFHPFFFRFPLGTCILLLFFPLLRFVVRWLRFWLIWASRLRLCVWNVGICWFSGVFWGCFWLLG